MRATTYGEMVAAGVVPDGSVYSTLVYLSALARDYSGAEALLGALRLFPYGSEASVAHADALWRRLEQTVVWGEVAQGDADAVPAAA